MKNTKLWMILVGLMLVVSACARVPDTPGERTPIPPLPPATLPAPDLGVSEGGEAAALPCNIAAVDLIGAWVQAGTPETEPFDFTDAFGTACEGTFEADVLPLFTQANLWFDGALACSSCHGSDLKAAAAQLDLTSYAGILAGARRTSADAPGEDILGGGNWEGAKLYQMLVSRAMPIGRPPDSPEKGPVIPAGTPKK